MIPTHATSPRFQRLSPEFWNRWTPEVAYDLIGKGIYAFGKQGLISETEAYRGADDPASHAFRGPTPRCRIMFEQSGHAYIYLIYGMHFCFNIVTERAGEAGAILIRGLWTESGEFSGPGRVCRFLEITRQHSGLNLNEEKNFFLFEPKAEIVPSLHIETTSRVGIRQGTDKLWRYVRKGNEP